MNPILRARVLDLTDASGVFCTKLLATLGADVVRVEPPGGHETRRIGPFYEDKPHPERSLHWLLYNINKRSITLNIAVSDGRALFRRLAQTADIVVECFKPGYLDALGLGYETLRRINPSIILTSITPFGQTGAFSNYEGGDAVVSAMGGLMYQTGAPSKPPLHASVDLAYMQTGAQAFAGTLLANYHRTRTGQGQHVDVSQQECAAWAAFPSHVSWKAMGVVATRDWDHAWVPGTPRRHIYFKCLDGWVAAYPTYWNHMPIAVQWMKDEGLGEEIERTGVERCTSMPSDEVVGQVSEVFAALAARFPKRYLFKEGQARGMQVAPINTMEEILHEEHLRARGYFVDVSHPELGRTITYPGPPFKLAGMDPDRQRPAPRIGEHNREVYIEELGLSDEELCRYRQANAI